MKSEVMWAVYQRRSAWLTVTRNLEPKFKHSNLWKILFLSFYWYLYMHLFTKIDVLLQPNQMLGPKSHHWVSLCQLKMKMLEVIPAPLHQCPRLLERLRLKSKQNQLQEKPRYFYISVKIMWLKFCNLGSYLVNSLQFYLAGGIS